MRPSYLTFDCYGTLVDWEKGISDALPPGFRALAPAPRGVLKEYVEAEKQEERAYKKYRDVLHDSVVCLGSKLRVAVSEAEASRFASSVPEWPAFPDTPAALRSLGRKGYKRYILSNVDTDLLQGTIRNQDLEVDGFVTAEQVGSYKPNPGHWLEFLKRSGAKKAEVLHVAQSLYHDISPTQQMGISSAWVNRYGESLPESLNPAYTVGSVGELSGVLE